MLFTRPGALTRRYMAGERVRFVSPLALFLFLVFPMVATFETVGSPIGGTSVAEGQGAKITPAKLHSEIDDTQARIGALEQRRDKAGNTAEIAIELKALRKTTERLSRLGVAWR